MGIQSLSAGRAMPASGGRRLEWRPRGVTTGRPSQAGACRGSAARVRGELSWATVQTTARTSPGRRRAADWTVTPAVHGGPRGWRTVRMKAHVPDHSFTKLAHDALLFGRWASTFVALSGEVALSASALYRHGAKLTQRCQVSQPHNVHWTGFRGRQSWHFLANPREGDRAFC